MNSQIIVDKYNAKLEGQQMLWNDYDLILKRTPFQSIDLEFDKEALVHWWMHIVDLGECNSNKVYRSWNTALWKYFKHCMPDGSYNVHTGQAAVKLKCLPNAPIEDIVEELKVWIKELKPFEYNGTVLKKIHIFEHTLSQWGTYDLLIKSETDFEVVKNRWTVQKFSSLADAVKYIRTYHYYE